MYGRFCKKPERRGHGMRVMMTSPEDAHHARSKLRPTLEQVKALPSEDQDFLRPLVQAVLQKLLEAEMTEALGAEKGERTPARLGHRSGYYGRTLITRVGKLELRVPQDRAGRFSTELFEREQRSEKALVAALAEMSVQTRRSAAALISCASSRTWRGVSDPKRTRVNVPSMCE